MATRQQLERQLAAITDQLDRLDSFPPEDPYRDGQALRFKWQSPTSGRLFTYVTLRAGGKWYTTGRESLYARPWPTLVEWLLTGNVDSMEILVPKSKYDRKLAKARAAAQLAATQSGTRVTRVAIIPDPAAVKDLFEDLVVLRTLSHGQALAGIPIPVPVIDRVLEYAKAAITNTGSMEAAVFLAAMDRYRNGMRDTDSRD